MILNITNRVVLTMRSASFRHIITTRCLTSNYICKERKD